MLRITDPQAVRFLRADFISTWANHNRVRHSQFDGLELFTLDGRNNRQAFQRVLDLIDTARHTIFVESPYITFPFYEPLREATRRGVEVKIVTPAKNNWNYFARYARVEAARSRIDLRLYRGGMSHLKAMLIDDQFLIAGSSNFDYLSYRLYQEILAVITEPEVISTVATRASGHAVPVTGSAKGGSGCCWEFATTGIATLKKAVKATRTLFMAASLILRGSHLRIHTGMPSTCDRAFLRTPGKPLLDGRA